MINIINIATTFYYWLLASLWQMLLQDLLFSQNSKEEHKLS